MTRHLRFPLAVLAVLLAASLAPAQSAGRPPAAQTAQPAGPASPAPGLPVQPPAAKPSTAPAEAEGPSTYTYRAEGRRDPFVSLWNPGGGPRENTKVAGLAGLYTVDLMVKGILQSRGSFVAIVVGPGGTRQYILHATDRLADGVVKAITADSVLILQEVGDPLSHAKLREIRKTLRAVEEVK